MLFAHKQSRFIFEKVFNNESSITRALRWACEISSSKPFVFAHEEIKNKVEEEMYSFSVPPENLIAKNEWTLHDFLVALSEIATKGKSVVFAFADEPFLSAALSESEKESHERYKSEFTFAEGFAGGLSPLVIDSGTIGILLEFLREKWKEDGEKPFSRKAIYELVMKDPNSFDIESVLSEEDARLSRIELNVETKRGLLACLSAFEEETKNPDWDSSLSNVDKFSAALCLKPSVMQTLPAFYSLEISPKSKLKSIYFPKNPDEECMSFSNFELLAHKIKDFSSDAVVSLSIFGEPTLHPDFFEFCKILLSLYLTPLIETDGLSIDEKLCEKLCEAEKNSRAKCIWILKLDAVSEEMYEKVHKTGGLLHAEEAAALLSRYFPSRVYVQFVRMKTNESELEKFFRKWSASESSTGGKCIIQKYSNFCGALKNEEVADFSPISRNVCWHLCRDMCVFSDGKVPLCREMGRKNIQGDAFTEDLGDIWARFTPYIREQFKGEYKGGCEKCDEYYTFNF